MRSWQRWRSDRIAYILIIILFFSHLPFISSDPDRFISFSRGPFTDEGLNTVQVRNLVDHGYLSFSECDNLLKTPMLSATLALPFLVFGTHLSVARLTILVIVLLILLWLSREKPFSGIALILVPLLFFKYQVFQFSHFSLAEMPAALFILAGVFFLFRAYRPFGRERNGHIDSIFAAFFISLAYYFKIQFFYIVLLAPLIAMERAFWGRSLSRRARLGNGLAIIGTTLTMALIYLLAWYLPNKETYDFMMVHQSGGISIGADSIRTIGFNVVHFLLSDINLPFTLIFLACVATGFFLSSRSNSGSFRLLFTPALLWFLLESHKLLMVYWPTRYQVSMYVAMGLLIAVVFHELITGGELFRNKKSMSAAVRIVLLVLIGILTVTNLSNYFKTLERREFTLREANRYLADHLDKDDLVIGAWAPSLTWESGSRSFPVWGGFLNDADPLVKYSPRVVVSEPDEQDSEQAYSRQGIDLKAISDSIRSYPAGNWIVNIYWLK